MSTRGSIAASRSSEEVPVKLSETPSLKEIPADQSIGDYIIVESDSVNLKQKPIIPKPCDENSNCNDVAVSVHRGSIPEDKLNCCFRFWRFIYIQGSLVGPAPCSFLWLCAICNIFGCNKIPMHPLKRSSFSTKLMYIIALGFVMFFSSFFIISYPEHSGVKVAQFSPCIEKGEEYHKISGWWGDCRGHAGYFIVYRIFFAWIIMLLLLILVTIGVGNSKETCRPALHQGFWLFKLMLFLLLCIPVVLFISVRSPFDESFMFIGLTATIIFSIPQLVSFLDLFDIIVTAIKSHPIKVSASWCSTFDSYSVYDPPTEWDWRLGYWGLTGLVYTLDLVVITFLCLYYTQRTPSTLDNLGEPMDYGSGKYCLRNIYMIVYCAVVGVVVTIAMVFHMFVFKSKTYPHVGVMHSSLVFGHTLFCVYTALGNTEDLECRVVWYPYTYNKDSLDVTFTLEGFIHVFGVWFTLIYFALAEGPRSNAPLSRLIKLICCKTKEPPPSLSQIELTELPPSEMLKPEERELYLIHNDEAKQLQYNWALFHVFLILASLSMMMGMTNFFRPRADGPNFSNIPAFACKLSMSPVAVVAFLAPLVISWFKDRQTKSADDEELSLTLPETFITIARAKGEGSKGIIFYRQSIYKHQPEPGVASTRVDDEISEQQER